MKKIILFVAGIIVLFVGSSCQKELDLRPHSGLVEKELFKNEQGFQYAIRSLYTGMKNDGFAGSEDGIHIMGDVLSDNLMYNPTGRGTKQSYFIWKISPSITFGNAYAYSYKLASRANVILKNINNIPPSKARDNIEGQALAMRALAHLEILRWFAQIPTQSASASQSLGIYYQDKFEPAGTVATRQGTTVQESYDKVIKDLIAASDKIAEENPSGYLTLQSVYSLLTRAYLYMGDYDQVVYFADLALAGPVKIAKADEFGKIWKDDTESSAVIKILIQDKDRIATGNPYSQTLKGAGVKSEYVCRKSLKDLFQANDVRSSSSFQISKFQGKDYIHVAKYFGRATGNLNTSNYKYLRLEEVLLSKAEALSKKGDDAGALAALDELRKERYIGFTPGTETGAALFDAIILERRLEFAFEGDRFFTLKRLGMGLSRDGNEKELADGTGTYAHAAIEVPATDYRWVLAIPQDALNVNPSAKSDQNPGY